MKLSEIYNELEAAKKIASFFWIFRKQYSGFGEYSGA